MGPRSAQTPGSLAPAELWPITHAHTLFLSGVQLGPSVAEYMVQVTPQADPAEGTLLKKGMVQTVLSNQQRGAGKGVSVGPHVQVARVEPQLCPYSPPACGLVSVSSSLGWKNPGIAGRGRGKGAERGAQH